jgi:hypothetical protein
MSPELLMVRRREDDMGARLEQIDRDVHDTRGPEATRQMTSPDRVAAATRPRRAPRERHSEASLVRFTRDEWRAVLERARMCGRAPAVYIREAALGAAPKARRVPENAELIRQLTRVGNALVALAAASGERADEAISRDVELALADVMEAVRRVG